MKVSLEEGERKNGGFTAVSSHEISRIFEFWRESVVKTF